VLVLVLVLVLWRERALQRELRARGCANTLRAAAARFA
jgi:hypothetical protein